ncbi:hypothetical protein Hypma_006803 [Hypsizygus marmoreus]|uniref:Uncharacterized protein n=1 Tax=Hypsizygus marmoreus TaxID=39966 RepID=A0A369K1Y3_HYPMA|nr:hypothetical protein Hypma_006803 [Hypsizygus marmoreus]
MKANVNNPQRITYFKGTCMFRVEDNGTNFRPRVNMCNSSSKELDREATSKVLLCGGNGVVEAVRVDHGVAGFGITLLKLGRP